MTEVRAVVIGGFGDPPHLATFPAPEPGGGGADPRGPACSSARIARNTASCSVRPTITAPCQRSSVIASSPRMPISRCAAARSRTRSASSQTGMVAGQKLACSMSRSLGTLAMAASATRAGECTWISDLMCGLSRCTSECMYSSSGSPGPNS